MAWNHDDVAPNRSRDELLGDVVRRGERIRLRRRILGGVGGGIVVLLAVAGVASVAGIGGEPTTELAAGGRSTTTLAAGPAVGGTVFSVDAPSTTVADASTQTTLVPATTVPPASGQPSGPATTTTTPPVVVPDVVDPPAAQPRCGPAVMQATMTMAPSFVMGQPVTGQAVLRNTSGAPCHYFSYTNSFEVTDSLGNPVGPGSALIADAFEDTPFGPAQTLEFPLRWDPPAAGTYRVVVRWSFDGPPVEVATAFTVT